MKQISLEEAKGLKLVTSSESFRNEQFILLFEGGAFVTLGLSDDWDRADRTIEEQSLEKWEFGDELLIKLGIVTQPEVGSYRESAKEKLFREQEDMDRKRYEQLKQKFEGN